MSKELNADLFEKMPVGRAALSLMIPTIISQLIGVVYNVSDTFFIGKLNSPAQIAAITLAMPTFFVLMAIGNIFGIGGASLMARCLGQHNPEKARQTCSFCLWTAIAFSILYGVLFWLFSKPILFTIGATEQTYAYAAQYTFWTIIMGAVPAMLAGLLAHLVRAEGYAKQASFGMVLGMSLNILLDPIFIFGFKMGVEGAAVATVIAQMTGVCYLLHFIWRRPPESILCLSPRCYSLKNNVPSEVLLVGLPSALLSLMAILSNVVLNVLAAGYATAVVAGMGIAKRLDMVIFALSNGIGQGVLPLISYTFAAKNFKRMRAAIKISLVYSLILATLVMLVLYFGATQAVRLFIEDTETVHYGRAFLKVICLTCPCVSFTLIILTIFQAAGKKVAPLVLSIARKGGFDTPLMYFLSKSIGVMGLAWAVPVSDFLGMLTAFILFIPFWKKLKQEELKSITS